MRWSDLFGSSFLLQTNGRVVWPEDLAKRTWANIFYSLLFIIILDDMTKKLTTRSFIVTWRCGLATNRCSVASAGRFDAMLIKARPSGTAPAGAPLCTVRIGKVSLGGGIHYYFLLTSMYVENKRILYFFCLSHTLREAHDPGSCSHYLRSGSCSHISEASNSKSATALILRLLF